MITYHYDVPKTDNIESTISHEVLSLELKEYLERKGVQQERYYFDDNGYYFFIYLNNGDRVDVSIKN